MKAWKICPPRVTAVELLLNFYPVNKVNIGINWYVGGVGVVGGLGISLGYGFPSEFLPVQHGKPISSGLGWCLDYGPAQSCVFFKFLSPLIHVINNFKTRIYVNQDFQFLLRSGTVTFHLIPRIQRSWWSFQLDSIALHPVPGLRMVTSCSHPDGQGLLRRSISTSSDRRR